MMYTTGPIAFLALAAILVSLIAVKKYKIAKDVTLAIIVSWVITFALKFIVRESRPYNRVLYIPFTHIIDYSFPSSHSAVAFAIACVLAKEINTKTHDGRALELAVFLVAFLVAESRVYFGFHHVLDVVVGSLIGIFIGEAL